MREPPAESLLAESLLAGPSSGVDVVRLLPSPTVLLGGCPTWWPADAAPPFVVAPAMAASVQLAVRANSVAVTDPSLLADAGVRRAVLHNAMQHLLPAGVLLLAHRGAAPPSTSELGDALVHRADLAVGDETIAVYHRTERRTVHDLVADARVGLRRVSAAALATALEQSDPPLVIDTRTPSDRQRHGTIAGAQHVPRTVVEWRLDPANGYLHPAIRGFHQALVVVCTHGYSSSLAAANLIALGYTDVADLIGGMAAWRAAGLPVVPPDHTFLEL